MYWYRIIFDQSYEAHLYIKSNERDIIASPIIYNDVVYGTIENPLYGSGFYKASYSASTQTASFPLHDVRYNTEAYGNRIIGSKSGNITVENGNAYNSYIQTVSDDLSLEDAVISGRWKPHDIFIDIDGNIYGYELAVYASVYYNGILTQTNRISNEPSKAVRSIDISAADIAKGKISVGEYEFSNLGIHTEDSFVDFGNAEQHVPKFIKDFFETNFDRVYDNTYAVKTDDGVTLAGSEPYMPPIKKTSLFWTAGNFRLTLSTIEDYPIILEWSNPTPEGKKLKGLSIRPNGDIIVPIGDRVVEILRSVDFYMVYEDEEPIPIQPLPRPVDRPLPDDAYNINLYKNTAEANRLDKTAYLTSVRTLRGVMRESSSVTDLTITIQYPTYPDFNYVRIPELKRYYFVNDITLINANMYELDLSVDPLMSYKTAILGLTAFVDRNELLSNPRIIDKKRVVEQGVDIEVGFAANQVFDEVFNPDTSVRFVMNGYKLSVRPNQL